MAGRSSDRLGARTLQEQNDFHGKLGRDDGIRRGQTLRGIEDFILERVPRARGGSLAGRDEKMKGVRGSACFENGETEFRCSKCSRDQNAVGREGWRLQTRGQICIVESRGEVEDQVVRTCFRREKLGDEYLFRGMMWADNFWLSSDDKEKLVCMMNDIIEELLDLDMEPKLESLWWTTTYREEDVTALKVRSREGKLGTCQSLRYLMSWAIVSDEVGKGCRGRR